MADDIQNNVIRHAQRDMANVPTASHAEKRSVLGEVWDSLKDPQQYAVLGAEFRRGLKDLQDVVLDPWHGKVAVHEELGTIANPTPQIITQEMGSSYTEMLDQAARDAARRNEPGQGMTR